MTSEEMYAQVYAEQGFLVMASNEVCEIGSIDRPWFYGSAESPTPLRCIGPSNHPEFAAQVKRMNKLQGTSYPSHHETGFRYYRMEPTD